MLSINQAVDFDYLERCTPSLCKHPTEVVLQEAKRQGVMMLPPNVNHSGWTYGLERSGNCGERLAIRVGLVAVKGLGRRVEEAFTRARQRGPFVDLADFCRRTRLPQDGVENLVRAGAFDDMGHRRDLQRQLWQLDLRESTLGLSTIEEEMVLPALPALQATLHEYAILGYAPGC